MGKTCVAIKCPSKEDKTKFLGVGFYKFPREKYLRARWLANLGRVDPVTNEPWKPKYCSYLCSEHFAPECFKGEKPKPKPRKLRPDAVPTIFLSEEEKAKEDSGPYLRKCRKLAKQVKKLKTELEQRRHKERLAQRRVCARDKIILKLQQEGITKDKMTKFQLEVCNALKRKSVSPEVREFCLKIFHHSPKIYAYLRRYFHLPRDRVVRLWWNQPGPQSESLASESAETSSSVKTKKTRQILPTKRASKAKKTRLVSPTKRSLKAKKVVEADQVSDKVQVVDNGGNVVCDYHPSNADQDCNIASSVEEMIAIMQFESS